MAPSAIAPADTVGFSADFEQIEHPVPHELTADEIAQVRGCRASSNSNEAAVPSGMGSDGPHTAQLDTLVEPSHVGPTSVRLSVA